MKLERDFYQGELACIGLSLLADAICTEDTAKRYKEELPELYQLMMENAEKQYELGYYFRKLFFDMEEE